MDRSCNLKCPSCREQVIIEKQSDKIQQQIKIFEEIRQWALDNPKVHLTLIPVGSGEVFASHSALEFLKSLQDYPLDNLKLHLTSNGTLIKKNQQLIFNLKHLITNWSISVDAATPETYAQVRGGNWNDLIDGLDLIQEMRISPVFKFCIQKNNYHEIEQFAELAVKYQAKSISYQKLMDWGHWDIQWWHDQNVFDRTRPSFEQALTSLQIVINRYGSLIHPAADLSKYLERSKESP
jgi:MoaA/NifB/PqqE/SkfB family radical SAM enzyme